MKNTDARRLSRGALIAAMYVALTYIFRALSFGAVQFRLSEALCLLPAAMPEAVPGVAVGCLLANLLLGGTWLDVLFGTLATLIAALLTRRLRRRPVPAALMPAIVNAVVVGPVIYLSYTPGTGAAVLLTGCAGVFIGEAVVCCAAGLPLLRLARKYCGTDK